MSSATPRSSRPTSARRSSSPHDGRPFLEWHSHTWLLDEAGDRVRPLATELGFWRPLDGGEIELLLTQNTGILEMYVGRP